MVKIRGSGGGGKGDSGSSRVPVESPDSLRSRQYARVLDAVSEGEIVGLVDGLRSVYLNDTPVQNADGSFNFQGVTLTSRNGTQSQSYIPGFGAVESERAVSVRITQALPVVRTVGNLNTNAVRITVSIPQLTQQDPETGDIGGTSVQIAIDVQGQGSGFVEKMVDTITGKTTSQYQRSYRVPLDGVGPWDVRVRRITADSTSQSLQNTTIWSSYTEIIDAKLRYPNTALQALQVDAERFQSIPTRGYKVKGIKVRIPSNYDPISRTYTGAWDGTFTTDWTNNPAWCFFDLLTSKRYGLGEFLSIDQVDKWTMYQIAKHCDELVPDGYGGLEPRFVCNLYIQTQEEAYSLLNSFASIFCGTVYWAGGSVVATQDAPADPVKLFTTANTVSTENGNFSYAGSSIKARHTVALVTWNDPSDLYRQKIEYVEDADGIARYGVVQTEVVALGCTSRGQAHRFGRRLLYSERMETEVISFRTGLDGLDILPGDIVQTSDPVRSGVRMGGRVLSATPGSIAIDSEVSLAEGVGHTIWVTLPNGKIETRAVTTGAGMATTLAVSPSFSETPQAMSVWVLAADNLVPESWRVVSVSEVDGMQAEITALAYRPDKYGAIESDLRLEPLQTSALQPESQTPFALQVVESLYLVNPAVVGAKVTVSWSGTSSYYELSYRLKTGNWATITTRSPSVDIQPIEPGRYEFSVVGINAIGARSRAATMTREIQGKFAQPASVSDFSVTKVSGVALAAWRQHAELDVIVGGWIVIRHSPVIDGATWNDSYVLDEFPGSSVSGIVPLMTGTYFAKARDSSGNWSTNAVSFLATEGMVTGFNTVASSVQAPAFPGEKDGTAVVEGGLQIDGTLTLDEVFTTMDSWSMLDVLGGVAAQGEYTFDSVMDLGEVSTRRFEVDTMVETFDTGDFIDARASNLDTWASVDGAVVDDCDITVFAETSDDLANWSEKTPFFVSDFTCRAVRFSALLESGQDTHNISVKRLTVRAKVPV